MTTVREDETLEMIIDARRKVILFIWNYASK